MLAVNTLPSYCSRHVRERNGYQRVFGRVYAASYDINKIFWLFKDQKDVMNGISKDKMDQFKRMFTTMDINTNWLKRVFDHEVQIYTKPLFSSSVTYLFEYTFLNNKCLF